MAAASNGGDERSAATFRRFLDALGQTEKLPPEHLVAYQRRLLDTLLRHARRETDFYADRLAPLFRADDTIDWERWGDIPILTRAEVQANAGPLTAREPAARPPAAVRIRQSSGSTAEPLRYAVAHLQNVATAAANERFFDWHGIEPASLFAAFIWAMDDAEDGGLAATAVPPMHGGRFTRKAAAPTSPSTRLSAGRSSGFGGRTRPISPPTRTTCARLAASRRTKARRSPSTRCSPTAKQ